ncbi:MAG: VOC family protein [Pseudanabaenaceae cyanobacterium bins.68]|nr:VOC family protein [Pseudanabaenaceae cyanobacterium bins.68]
MQLDSINLFVQDLERSRQFYQQLGFSFDQPPKQGGLVGYNSQIKLGLYELAWLTQLFGMLPPSTGNALIWAIAVDDLDYTYQQLLSSGIESLQAPAVMPWGQRVAFLRDPDGNLVELFAQCPTRLA